MSFKILVNILFSKEDCKVVTNNLSETVVGYNLLLLFSKIYCWNLLDYAELANIRLLLKNPVCRTHSN